MSNQVVVLLLGSNLGDKKNNVLAAIRMIEEAAGAVTHRSRMVETAPVGFESPNNFCNIAVSLETKLSPAHLLMALKSIEKKMGRQQDSKKVGFYADRIVDIDIVSYGNLTFKSEALVLPHYKHLFERDFSREILEDLKQNRTV